MKLMERTGCLENKKTLDFLISITEILKSSNAMLGRNDEMFAIDTIQVPKLLMREKESLGRHLMERKLVVEKKGLFGVMGIVTGLFSDKNIMFCEIADSLSPINDKGKEYYPYHEEVRDWFLSIPQFSKKDKGKYESIYNKNKTKISKIMHDYAEELHKVIFSFESAVDD